MDEKAKADASRKRPHDKIAHQDEKEKADASRKRPHDFAYQEAYKDLTYVQIPSSGRPGTPHSFFKESYSVDNQIVHQHANGLCIVTAGRPMETTKIEFAVQAAPHQSLAEKRKSQSKRLKGKQVVDSVHPRDCLVTLDDVSLKCCVWGTILEVNDKLSSKLLSTDPLLDGYLAVILPTGPFPPKNQMPAVKEEVAAAPL
jgi:hypothetical protein